MSSKPKLHDYVSRIKRPSPLGRTIFVGLRNADIFIQYGILANGLASPLLNLLRINPQTSAPIVAFGLPMNQLVILAMAAGSAFKQSFTTLYTHQEEMPPASAVLIAFFNTVFNSFNSVFSLTLASTYFLPSLLTAQDPETGTSPVFWAGVGLYVLGITTELVSELQRTWFKADPKNEGKAFTGGLFGLARHVNYGGFTIWRGGYALATGGWLWGAAVFGFFFRDFVARGVPVLDGYCADRWVEFKKKVQWKLIPGIY